MGAGWPNCRQKLDELQAYAPQQVGFHEVRADRRRAYEFAQPNDLSIQLSI